MKRSQMVERIYDLLNCDGVLEYSMPKLEPVLLTEEHVRWIAEQIVQEVEQSGMLPPPDNTDVIHSNLVYCYYIDKTYEGRERVFEIENSYGKLDYSRSKLWEPEDE